MLASVSANNLVKCIFTRKCNNSTGIHGFCSLWTMVVYYDQVPAHCIWPSTNDHWVVWAAEAPGIAHRVGQVHQGAAIAVLRILEFVCLRTYMSLACLCVSGRLTSSRPAFEFLSGWSRWWAVRRRGVAWGRSPLAKTVRSDMSSRMTVTIGPSSVIINDYQCLLMIISDY